MIVTSNVTCPQLFLNEAKRPTNKPTSSSFPLYYIVGFDAAPDLLFFPEQLVLDCGRSFFSDACCPLSKNSVSTGLTRGRASSPSNTVVTF